MAKRSTTTTTTTTETTEAPALVLPNIAADANAEVVAAFLTETANLYAAHVEAEARESLRTNLITNLATVPHRASVTGGVSRFGQLGRSNPALREFLVTVAAGAAVESEMVRPPAGTATRVVDYVTPVAVLASDIVRSGRVLATYSCLAIGITGETFDTEAEEFYGAPVTNLLRSLLPEHLAEMSDAEVTNLGHRILAESESGGTEHLNEIRSLATTNRTNRNRDWSTVPEGTVLSMRNTAGKAVTFRVGAVNPEARGGMRFGYVGSRKFATVSAAAEAAVGRGGINVWRDAHVATITGDSLESHAFEAPEVAESE